MLAKLANQLEGKSALESATPQVQIVEEKKEEVYVD
jgi:hypothetical protein